MNKKLVTCLLILLIVVSIHQIFAGRTYLSAGDRFQALHNAWGIVKGAGSFMDGHPLIRSILYFLLLLGMILTILMTIDCAINKREPQWFLIMWLLAPIGVTFYMAYFWEQITFPCSIAACHLAVRLPATETRRCSRCGREGVELVAFDDGRQVQFVCEMCRSELDLNRNL